MTHQRTPAHRGVNDVEYDDKGQASPTANFSTS
jgi:hypothetical protein